MSRLNVLLLVLVVASALYVVHSQYEARRLFVELEAARKEGQRLQIEQERLQVEHRAQATPLRVEQLARQQLQMRAANPAITQYVTRPAGVASAPQEGAR